MQGILQSCIVFPALLTKATVDPSIHGYWEYLPSALLLLVTSI